MVCHRWTLALIIFAVALLVTVISAFRVRLPGTSHDVKSDLRKHKCKDCDVDDLNLDPITHSLKKESAKRSYDGIKKILKDKRHLIEEKLSKTSFDHYNLSKDEIEVDDTNVSEDDLKESTLKSVELSSNLHGKTRNKKASVILDFDDDDDSDIEEDDEYDDINQKSSKKSSSAENKKKIESIEDLYNDIRPITKSKAIVKEKTDKKIYDKDDIREIKVESKLQSKKKVDILAPKEILKESPTSKDELLKPLKREIKGDIHKEEVKKSFKSSDPIKPTSIEKTKDASSKESSILKPQADKLGLKVKEDTILVDNEKIISKKADVKIPAQKVKEDDIEIKPKISEKREEKAGIKEKIKIAIENKKSKIFDELKVDSQQSVRTSDTKEACAQQLPEALVRRNLLQSEFEDFYVFFPTFAPNFSRIHNPECRRHGQILLRQLRGTKLWALNMLDATAKIPSGLLQGNAIQLGDFDQCLGVRARVQLDTGSIVKIQGKYCLAMVDVKAEHPDLEAPVHLAQARNVFKSRIDDPGHFVPRFSTLSWGVCVPAPCGPEDVEVVLRDAIKHYQYKTGISVRVKVDEMDCHVRTGANWWKDWLEMRTILTLSLYAIVVILVLLATLQDYLARNSSEDTGDKDDEVEESENKENEAATKEKQSSGGFLCSFSLYNSLSKLVAPVSKDEIACIHGLRALATVALLVAHKFLPVALTPYTNRIRLSEIVTSPLLSWCRAGWMFTDCFLLLSGTLTSYRKSTDDTIASKLISRYIRLTPALLVVVLFYAYVWDYISSGPMWGALVTKNVEVCRQGWWWNLLYVQNYYGFEDMCAPQTHHMALDFQLTVVGGLIIWALQSEVPFSTTVMPILHLLSAYSRYTTFRDHRLTALAYHGVSVSQLYRTGRLSYISVFHRCTPYFIGISLGLVLRKPSNHSKFINILGWFICGTLIGVVLWAGGDSGYLDYRYDVTFASIYATLAPIATALAIAWLVYGVHNNHSNILSSLLCCRPLIFISRISYALYLVQFIVYLTNTALTRAPKEFSLLTVIDLQEVLVILFTSIILTITLVIPLQSLPKITFGSKTVEKVDDKEASNSKPLETIKENETQTEQDEHTIETPQVRRSFLAHREILEEIPEVEIEYEMQRDSLDGLEEILEEEDETLEEEMIERLDEEDLEIIEEEQGEEEAGEHFWDERRNYLTRRSFTNDQNLDEWEWTANGNERTGSQQYRHNR